MSKKNNIFERTVHVVGYVALYWCGNHRDLIHDTDAVASDREHVVGGTEIGSVVVVHWIEN